MSWRDRVRMWNGTGKPIRGIYTTAGMAIGICQRIVAHDGSRSTLSIFLLDQSCCFGCRFRGRLGCDNRIDVEPLFLIIISVLMVFKGISFDWILGRYLRYVDQRGLSC